MGIEKFINTVTCGDSFDLMPQFPDESIDMVVTDAPYGINYKSNHPKGDRQKDYIANDSFADYLKLVVKFRKELDRILAPNSEAYIFCGGGGATPSLAYSHLLYGKSKRFIVKNIIVWDKQFVGLGWDWRFQWESIIQLQRGDGLQNNMGGTSRANILRCNNEIPQAGEHPTPKPVKLIERILMAKKSYVVYDPFAGGGSTVIACIRQKRNFIASEIERKYYDMIIKKVEIENSQLLLF